MVRLVYWIAGTSLLNVVVLCYKRTLNYIFVLTFSQVLLVNPICMIGYTLVSWSFFNKRVFYEEITLLNFFGTDYYDYQQKVGTGLPFIEGYVLEKEDDRNPSSL